MLFRDGLLFTSNVLFEFVQGRYKDRVRLGAPPHSASLAVSKSMKSNIRKDTKPELALRRMLTDAGAGDFVPNDGSLPGTPDFAFHKEKVAVFVYGCFWHGCPWCSLRLPKTNRAFWKRKLDRNRRRDRRKRDALRKIGWKTMSVWECKLKTNPKQAALRIAGRITRP